MCSRGGRTALSGSTKPAWPGPGARTGPGGSSGTQTLLPGLCRHPLAHLVPQNQTRPRGLCTLTPHLAACVHTLYIYLYIYVYTHTCVSMKNLSCFSFDHMRGYFAGNHHQAHLGHSLTPPPAAALSGRQSWRDPSHCAAQQAAGRTPRPSAPLRRPAQHRAPPGALEARSSLPRSPICSEAIANV